MVLVVICFSSTKQEKKKKKKKRRAWGGDGGSGWGGSIPPFGHRACQRPARLGALVGNQSSLPLVLRGGCFPGIPEFALAQKFGLLHSLLALQW